MTNDRFDATGRLNDPDAAVMRVCNGWLADFCSKHPERLWGSDFPHPDGIWPD